MPVYTLLVFLLCLGLMYRRKQSRWGWLFLLLLLPLILNVFMFATLWIPYTQLIDGCPGSRPMFGSFFVERVA